jgi:chromosome segregation protein
MPFIKELVIHGFKSFARETRIPFRNTMNTIVGPNGSGKSNVTDAICFVLGRMGSKSMRAKKLANLIFAGTTQYKPSNEASVEMIFDNTDKGFSLSNPEVSIKRILRRNGQGVYKINNEIKTRQEVLELLAQAGIDPNGFNIILQGEIDSFVRMSAEERKQVIEEVAGISIYEIRKKHSLNELERTEGKLKEANAILRERTAYLKNLEEERKQAMKFKSLQEDVKTFKASISHKMASEKQDKIEEINKQIEAEQSTIVKINQIISKTEEEIAVLNEKIDHITSNIQKSSGLEQDKLNAEISDIRAELAGMNIKKDNYESLLRDLSKRKEEISATIINNEKEIEDLMKSKGKVVKKDLEEKKKKLVEMDEQRRKLFILKSNLSSINYRVEEKSRQIQKVKNEHDFTFQRIQQGETEISIKDSLDVHREKIVILRNNLEKSRQELDQFNKIKIGDEKQIAILEKEIEGQIKIKSQVSSLDTCPLCKTKITKDHVNHVIDDAEKEIEKAKLEIIRLNKDISDTNENINKNLQTIRKYEDEIKTRSLDVNRLELINEKKDSLRRYTEEIKSSEKDYEEMLRKRQLLEEQLSSIKSSEENFETLRLEVQEMERHNESFIGLEATSKQRDLERNRTILTQIGRQIEENTELLKEISQKIEGKQDILNEKNDQDIMLKEKYKKTLAEKNQYHEKIHFYERNLMQNQNQKHLNEEKINNLKVERAQFLAQKEAIEQESLEFKEAKIMRLSIEELRKRLDETQRIIDNIGTVNMKALEVYDGIKEEYNKVQEKVTTILNEKEEILRVIEEIDKKKKKAFSQTLADLNVLFSRNFSQLSDKGIATLEPVDKENLMDAGIEMLIKVGKGKYFDTNSLSGGEKSLISLSLIFAIQEYKPYCFYIFDEIDAALDRRNSERLAALLKRYINKGQYIIITHNDSLITESPVIYGVSMQDKISKVVSLEI